MMNRGYRRAAGLMLGLLAVGCNPPETEAPTPADSTPGETTGTTARREVREALTATRDYLASKKAEYRRGTEEELATLRREYEELKVKVDRGEAGLKDDFNALGATVQQKLDQAGNKLRALGENDQDTTDSAAWDQLKGETDQAMAEARQSWSNLKQRFANTR